MMEFQIAGGSVPGTQHTKPGQPGWRNNQDAFSFRSSNEHLIAVVTDGCGAGAYSEVGARLGASIVTKALSELLAAESTVDAETLPKILTAVEDRLVQNVQSITEMLGNEQTHFAHLFQHFLFTVVGAIVTRDIAAIFSYGDGVFALNGEVTVIEEFEDNAPPYPGYRLAPGSMDDATLGFRVEALIAREDLSSLLIGTDGVEHLIDAATQPIPNVGGEVGPLSQFWENRRFVDNPDAIRRRLAVINCERVVDGRLRSGPLSDDTTLVVIQRDIQGE